MTRYIEDERQIEEAIKFLVFSMHESGKNPKPVILHTFRMALHIYNLGYDKDIVIAAMLHDVIEDTDVEIKEVEVKFGKKIAKLVAATTFDENIEDKTARYKEVFGRTLKAGKDALIVKAADLYDNVDYYHLASTEEMKKMLFEKLKYFIDNSKDELKDEAIYDELVNKYKRITKTL